MLEPYSESCSKSFLFKSDVDAFELEDATNAALEREHERLSEKKRPCG
jgi:hypothetical protein